MELLNESFTISSTNKDTSIYDYVSRAQLSNTNTSIILDYHSVLLTLIPNTTIELIITEEELNDYDYVMDGMIYEIEHKDNTIFTASFGGLLMKVETKNNIIGLHERMEIRVGIKI
ncbi:RNA polymerase Rpb8 [Spraguea lophii 42_110]|uniref:RNA polymerase Rpb8 n=1 Tax=Spraguea lophii (strain 42_110) TaxID=1358809 RepID=S7XH27_SPRLO|nr:RNA polymerase Rpb8 [Spraguea lophii 42_110]